jgi:hypothetical protein
VYFSFIGIDGVGKSTFAGLLHSALTANGHDARLVSWRSELTGQPWRSTRTVQQELWVESFRMMHLGMGADFQPPADFSTFQQGDWESRFGSASITERRAAGPLAAAWLEWSGYTVLRHESIRPLLARGITVIEDSSSLKMAYKAIQHARTLNDDPDMAQEIDRAEESLLTLFRTYPPDVPVIVSGPVDVAFKWRTEQDGTLGVLEDMSPVGGARGWPGFLEHQSASDQFFRKVAADWGWPLFEVTDADPAVNFPALLAGLREVPAAAALLDGYPS